VNRRDFLKSAGAAVVVAAVPLPVTRVPETYFAKYEYQESAVAIRIMAADAEAQMSFYAMALAQSMRATKEVLVASILSREFDG
jgi:TAT (twin-arginine translocation) pathway-exported protein